MTSVRILGRGTLTGTGFAETAVEVGVAELTVGTDVAEPTEGTGVAVALGAGVASGSDAHAIIIITMMERQAPHNRPETDMADPSVLSIHALQSPPVHYESSHTREVIRLDNCHVGGGDEDL